MAAGLEPGLRATLRPGDTPGGRFRLEERLGRGGFGDVWRASELLPDGTEVRQVALKLLAPELASADWAREAKVLASLRHRSLVTVFSAGLLDTAPALPFVAMELLAGETLARRVQRGGPVAWRRALAYVREVAAALDAIHAAEVIHLDLKPANLMLDPSGQVRVLDFGVASHHSSPAPSAPQPRPSDEVDLGTAALLDQVSTDQDKPGMPGPRAGVVGTPGFIAPEILEGRAPSPAADAYALGACLFWLLTGRLPQRSRDVPREPDEVGAWKAELRAATLAGDLLDLRQLAPQTPRGVVALARSLLALDPTRRPASLSAACDEVHSRPFGTPDPPYLGLQAYGREAEGFLFGRESDSERLAAELREQPTLVLQGASGSGKSSLAVAGVVPALARAFVDGRDDWVPVQVRPGHDIDAAVRRAREQHGQSVGVVVVIDQLEELVTQLSPEEKARFVLALQRYACGEGEPGRGRPVPGLRVLCTIREDFTTRVSSFGFLGDLFERSVRFIPPPSASSARDIVVQPARLAGVAIDDERAVVDDVLRELRSGEGRLPLVSFALAEWWERRAAAGLSAAAWQSIGGVAGALSSHAKKTLDGLPPEAQDAARTLCLRLVTPEDTRARLPEKDLRALGPHHALALDAFVAARLIDIDDGKASFSHEALLVAWGALVEWIADERADRHDAVGFVIDARRWSEATSDNKEDFLLRGGRQERAAQLLRDRPDLLLPAQGFIEASARLASRERRRMYGLVALVILSLSGVSAAAAAAGLTWRNREHEAQVMAQDQKNKALEQSYARQKHEMDARDASLAQRASELEAIKKEARICQNTMVRVEQEHRASLAHKFPADSFENRVTTFVLQLEHLWNLHDADRLVSFLAPEVEWFGAAAPREQVAAQLRELWGKHPHARWIVGEVSVSRKDSATLVRLTREERLDRTLNIAILQLTLQGEKPDKFAIEKATREKIIVASKTFGCP